jgi:hypothetical protein
LSFLPSLASLLLPSFTSSSFCHFLYSGDVADFKQLSILNFVKIIRLLRLARIQKFLRRFKIGSFFRVVMLFSEFFLLAHYVGCAFYLLGYSSLPQSLECSESREENWICYNNIEAESQSGQYIASLYWAITTLTSVGFGDLHPINTSERGFAAAVMLIGSAMYAVVFGMMTAHISNMNKNEGFYLEKLTSIDEYMTEHAFPESLKNEVRNYYEYMWSQHKSFNMSDSVLLDLPASLSNRIADYTHRRMLVKSGVLSVCHVNL